MIQYYISLLDFVSFDHHIPLQIQYQFVCESILKSYEEDYVEIEIPSHSAMKSPLSYH